MTDIAFQGFGHRFINHRFKCKVHSRVNDHERIGYGYFEFKKKIDGKWIYGYCVADDHQQAIKIVKFIPFNKAKYEIAVKSHHYHQKKEWNGYTPYWNS